ncbi:MAG: ribose-phosphate diphosphokinase [Oligoflexales bacterium]
MIFRYDFFSLLFLLSYSCFAQPILLDAHKSNHNQTSMFSNGNMQVELKDVSGEDVSIFLEDGFHEDRFFEALLQAYTARHMFARSIVVEHSQKRLYLDSVSENLMYDLLAVAGVESLFLKNTKKRLERKQSVFRTWPRQQKHVTSTGFSFQFPFQIETESCDALSISDKNIAWVELRGTRSRDILQALSKVYQYAQRGAYVHVISPYLPYSRSDKLYRGSGIVAQGRLVADLFSAAGAHVMTTVRPHSDQMVGFYDIPVLVVQSAGFIAQFLRDKKVDLVVSPDAGFQKEASKIASWLGVFSESLQKKRGLRGAIEDLSEVRGNVDGLNVAIVDDETCSGKTLALSAKELKSKGAKSVIAVVTHLTGSAKAALESTDIDQLVVSDTVPLALSVREHPKVAVLDANSAIVSEIYKHFSFLLKVHRLK